MKKRNSYGPKSPLVTIKCSADQAKLITLALEFYERVMGLGQTEEILAEWTMQANFGPEYSARRSHIKYLLFLLKYLMYDLRENENLGIYNSAIPRRIHQMYDIMKMIRHKIVQFEYQEGQREGLANNLEEEDYPNRHLRYTVDFDGVRPISDDPPIEVTVEPGEADEAEAHTSEDPAVSGAVEAVSVPEETVRGDAD
jgi:hypothetical protein